MHFTFRSMLHFESIFVKAIRSFVYWCSGVPALFVEKTILSPIELALIFCQRSVRCIDVGLFWAVYSVLLICQLFPQYYTALITLALLKTLVLSLGNAGTLCFLFQYFVGFFESFDIPCEFRIRLLISTEWLPVFWLTLLWSSLKKWHLYNIKASYVWTWNISPFIWFFLTSFPKVL